MEGDSKNKYSKLARFFINVDKLEKEQQRLRVKVSLAERINSVLKALFFSMALLILLSFLFPAILSLLGLGGPELIQTGWIIPMLMFPVIAVLGIAWSFSETYKRSKSGGPVGQRGQDKIDV